MPELTDRTASHQLQPWDIIEGLQCYGFPSGETMVPSGQNHELLAKQTPSIDPTRKIFDIVPGQGSIGLAVQQHTDDEAWVDLDQLDLKSGHKSCHLGERCRSQGR